MIWYTTKRIVSVNVCCLMSSIEYFMHHQARRSRKLTTITIGRFCQKGRPSNQFKTRVYWIWTDMLPWLSTKKNGLEGFWSREGLQCNKVENPPNLILNIYRKRMLSDFSDHDLLFWKKKYIIVKFIYIRIENCALLNWHLHIINLSKCYNFYIWKSNECL